MAKVQVDRFYEDFRKVEQIERQIKQQLQERAAALKSGGGTAKVGPPVTRPAGRLPAP